MAVVVLVVCARVRNPETRRRHNPPQFLTLFSCESVFDVLTSTIDYDWDIAVEQLPMRRLDLSHIFEIFLSHTVSKSKRY